MKNDELQRNLSELKINLKIAQAIRWKMNLVLNMSIFLMVIVLFTFQQTFAAESRMFKVGSDDHFPVIFQDKDGVAQGLYVDILTEIGRQENIRFEYVFGTWPDSLNLIKSGKIDLLPGVAYTNERSQFMNYSKNPILTVWGELYALKTSEINSILDVSGKRIGVIKTDINAKNFLELTKQFHINCELVELVGYEDVFKAVKSKTVDAGIVGVSYGASKQGEYGLRSTGVVFNPYDLYISTTKGKNQDLILIIDNYLNEWRNQDISVLSNAKQKWIYGSVGTVAVAPNWMINIFILLGIMVVVALAFIMLLKLQVQRSTKTLRESEELFRVAMESAPDGVYMNDLEGNFLYGNRKAEELLGYSREELLDRNFLVLNIIAEDSLNKAAELLKENIEYRSTGPDELELVRKDGRHILIEITTNVIQRGGKAAVLAFVRDITDRKKAEDALQESEEKFRNFADQALVGINLIQDDILRYINPKFSEIFGYTVEQCLGQSFDKLVHPEDLNTVKENIRKRLSGEVKTLQYEFRGIKKNNEIVHLEIFGASILFNGKPAATGTLLDITDRKQAVMKLQISEAQKNAILNGISANIAFVDKDLKILWANKSAADSVNQPPEEMIGHTCHYFWADPSEPCKNCPSLKAVESKKSEHITQYTPDGRVWDERGEPIFDTEGNLIGVVEIATDITERKQAAEEKAKLEGQLQQAQKMESIGSLAGGIAHDLNNILFPISGLSEMLLDDIPPDNPAHDSIEQIFKSAKRGSDLVKQILAFSRQSNPKKLPIRIQSILNETLKLSRAAIPMNIEITSHITTDCGMVSADPTQIHQIAMNLITNAFHAVEGSGGMIHIGLKEVAIGSFAEKEQLPSHAMPGDLLAGRYACITIYDTGTGIDQSLIDKIFDPYFTTKELGKGTGLGLSVVHGIVKEHGGDIRVYSEVGKGTTFNVYLPLLEDAKDSKTAAITRKYPTGHERILLVDDEEPILRMEQMMLERLGYQVTTRMSSPDALAAFKANPGNIDLVISDRGMANMTGDQLAGELISIRPGIPIILCTGFSNDNDVKRAKAMGVKGFLMKPVSIGDLAEMVRKVLDEVAEGGQVHDSGQADETTHDEKRFKDQDNG